MPAVDAERSITPVELPEFEETSAKTKPEVELYDPAPALFVKVGEGSESDEQ